MDEQCNKYEWYFTTQSEEDFQNHLKECPVCRQRHETLMKAGHCVQEVGEAYLKHQKHKQVAMMKKIACVFLLFFSFSGFMGYELYSSYSFQVNSLDSSVISDMGLPVDEYGFLNI